MRILIAEDEIATAKALKLMLEKSKYSVDTVHNGNDAWEYVSNDRYDVVVLDVMIHNHIVYNSTTLDATHNDLDYQQQELHSHLSELGIDGNDYMIIKAQGLAAARMSCYPMTCRRIL